LVVEGRLATAKTGTPSFKVVLEILEGEHAGRKCFYDIWLTPSALRVSGYELARLGYRSIHELDERPLPTGLLADVKVVIHRDDDGAERNRVKSFVLVDADAPAADFAPAEQDAHKAEGDAARLDVADQASTPSRSSPKPGKDNRLQMQTSEFRHTPAAPLLDRHGFNYETGRYESSTSPTDAKPNGRARR
jgi:hypothetical protein